MKRALLMIGVRKSGILPQLQAVESAIESMRRWAVTQGMAEEAIVEISDRGNRSVHAAEIRSKISEIVEAQLYSQLIVYFCGHGVNNGQSEFWLLTEAPRYSGEAVNLSLSAEDALYCGIPHVVFISDACRTAPASINALRVTGISVFPNMQYGSEKSGVDRFYACRLGDAALEIEDVEASNQFEAVYTKVLADVLLGAHPDDVVEPDPEDPERGIIRPWPLRNVLPLLVSQRVLALAGPRRYQVADADLSSDPRRSWVSFVSLAAVGAPAPHRGQDEVAAREILARDWTLARAAADRLARSAAELPADNDTLRVLGDSVEEIVVSHGSTQLRGEGRVELDLTADLSVAAVRFGSGSCAIVPCLRGRSVVATLENNQLVDIRYEPKSAGHPVDRQKTRERWEQLLRRSELSAGLRFGVDLLGAGPFAKSVELGGLNVAADPSARLYLAYWLYVRGQKETIQNDMSVEPQAVLLNRQSFLFDTYLLSGQLEGTACPGFPLLSRGWALMPTAVVDQAPPRLPSFWTLFAADHFDWLRSRLTENRG